MTRAAADALLALLQTGSAYHVRAGLAPGQGLICNNVLHCREPFEDEQEPGRCMLRARYHDSIAAR